MLFRTKYKDDHKLKDNDVIVTKENEVNSTLLLEMRDFLRIQ